MRADIPEKNASSDEGEGRLSDGTRRTDEGIASRCQQTAV